MLPTFCVLERINKNSTAHKDGVYTRLYRYLLREDIYYTAYKNLYANKGASTQGVDNDTADGFGKDYIKQIIHELKTLTYKPKPVRRKHIPKQNNTKMRPIGIPVFKDKLVQEVIRMYLEAIYEPLFSDRSHGFRPYKSCHSALGQIKTSFHGIKWFIEGDIKGCFDNIDHDKLVNILREKIKDSKFINLLKMFLKAGHIENWDYHRTQSGTPQGGIISPILANIYLNELDKKVEELKAAYDKPRLVKYTQEYTQKYLVISALRKRINRAKDKGKKARLINELRIHRKELVKIPCVTNDDKKLVYVRYADDFIIGVNGNKADCKNIKELLKTFLADKYKLELSEEKTKITHSSKYARFLGYDVRVRRNSQTKRTKSGVIKRTLNNTVELCVPLQEKIEKFVVNRKIAKFGKDGKLRTYHRTELINSTDLEILNTYNAQTRGICNYYRLASNYNKLSYFVYLMEYSCLKTIARKHKTSINKIRNKHINGKSWGIAYQTKTGKKRAMIVTLKQLNTERVYTPTVDIIETKFIYRKMKNEIMERLFAHKCEFCGLDNIDLEVHHVRSLKKLKNRKWEQLMREKRRITLMVCKECHRTIHTSVA
jgi:group II intron reverse transcriptase/maturase